MEAIGKDTMIDACKTISEASDLIKSNIDSIDINSIETLDIAIKELITIRGVIDFKVKTQLTQTDWRGIKELL